MANFALIQADTVAQVFDTDPHINADVRDVSAVPGIDVGWYIGIDGQYHSPQELTWAQARTAANLELTNTMNVSLRCLERQQPVPNEWLIYRDTLRGIRDSETGDPTQRFPPRPVYPPDIPAPPYYPAGESVWPPPTEGAVTFILPSGEAAKSAPRPLFFGMA